MAECTISRCSQERRIFRKEFQRWSRNILFVVGFERIAEEFMGRHRWKNFSTPFTDLENSEPVDWSPDDICYFCESKKNPPYDPASGLLQAGEDYLTCRIDADDQSISSDQGIAGVRWRKGGSSSPAGSLDQPLDLSLTSGRKEGERPCSRGSADSESDSAGSFLKVPHISMKPGQKRRFDPNGKRSYTEEELQAALRDIQSGKLGTRRAAVIYGIPRSTLRNKVYKMSNDRGRRRCVKQPVREESIKTEQGASKRTPTPPKKGKEEVKRSPAEGRKNGLSSSASESLRQLLKHTIIQKKSSAGEELSKRTEEEEEEEEEREEIKGSLEERREEDGLATAGYQWLSSQEYGHTLAPFLAQMLSNIQHLALSRGEPPRSSKDDLKLPLLPDLIRRLAEERLESACGSERQPLPNSSTHKPPIDTCTTAEEALSNVILKIPSFKPTKVPESGENNNNNNNHHQLASSTQSSSSQNSGNSSRGITVSLKELIARSINQRMGAGQFTAVSAAPPESRLADLGKQYVAANDLAEAETKTIQESTRACVLQNSMSPAEKRCRPKRGRYRNYDTDNLAQAVRAVQKGEMSVHRAGTHYGVPHSTLEYKVKERHLLRPKKRDGSISALLQQSSSGLPKRLEGNKILNGETVEQTLQPQHAQRLPVVPSVVWQGLPFFPVELAGSGSEHFFASQMMKRLQESVRQQQQQQHQEVRGHLLEGLIKATLEKTAVVGNVLPGTVKKSL